MQPEGLQIMTFDNSIGEFLTQESIEDKNTIFLYNTGSHFYVAYENTNPICEQINLAELRKVESVKNNQSTKIPIASIKDMPIAKLPEYLSGLARNLFGNLPETNTKVTDCTKATNNKREKPASQYF